MRSLIVVALVAIGACGSVTRELENIEPVSFRTGIIGGSVTDSLNQPIVGAEVMLLTANGDSVTDQRSKAFTFAPRGEYRFDDVRPGSYRLRARAAGYETATRTVGKLDAGERYTVVFALRRLQ